MGSCFRFAVVELDDHERRFGPMRAGMRNSSDWLLAVELAEQFDPQSTEDWATVARLVTTRQKSM